MSALDAFVARDEDVTVTMLPNGHGTISVTTSSVDALLTCRLVTADRLVELVTTIQAPGDYHVVPRPDDVPVIEHALFGIGQGGQVDLLVDVGEDEHRLVLRLPSEGRAVQAEPSRPNSIRSSPDARPSPWSVCGSRVPATRYWWAWRWG